MELARQDRLDDALAEIEAGIAEANADGDNGAIAMIACAAGLVCANAGRHGEAAAYYEQAARAVPDDAYTEWALGDVYKALGDRKASRAHWARFEMFAEASGDADLIELLRLHRERNAGSR
jgi:tetratricopeptide (TPR) repeat protein